MSAGRHRGYTLIELLMAATITAAGCLAAMMLVTSINNAASSSGGIYEGAASARNALCSVDLLIEQARQLGFRDASRVLVWRGDDNGDGQINVLELVLVRYNSAAKTLELMDVYFPPGTPAETVDAANTIVSGGTFVTIAGAFVVESHANRRTRTLLTGVSPFAVWLDKAGTAARLVQMTFTVVRGDGWQVFHTVMTPRRAV